MKEDRLRRQMARLDEMQRRTEERLARQQERVTERFEQARERLRQHVGDEPSDTQQRIIQAALELLNEEGLNNLSLRKLASRLDMQAPALYWHFKSKEVLIDYMAEAILRKEFADLTPRQDDEPWQEWLVATCTRLRNAMRAYRDGARVVAGAHLFPAVTLMYLFEISMESLVSSGLESRKANLIMSTAVHFVFGRVIEEQSSPSPEQIENFMHSDMLKRFPNMGQSIDEAMEDFKNGYDEFEDALRLIIR